MLKFFYGTVSSAKTMNLLATVYNYSLSGKKAFLIKPQIDTRFGQDTVKSRVGAEKQANLVLSTSGSMFENSEQWIDSDIIVVDECQFLTPKQIDELWQISCNFNIDVMCYGLRADFKTQLFEASKRLFEVADVIQEISSTCNRCKRPAIHNLKVGQTKDIFDGESVEISLDKFVGVCSRCYSVAKKKTEILNE